MKHILFFFIIFSLISLSSFAHEEIADAGELIKQQTLNVLYWGVIVSAIFTLYSIVAIKHPHFTNKKKMFAFLGIVIPIAIVTIYMVYGTIYLNAISETKGPVHWHADFEIYVCDEWVDLKDPSGVSNRIGTPLFHEHGDNRIHVEGTLERFSSADLENFFDVVGGSLTHDSITVPTNTGMKKATNGDLCDGKPGTLQAFVYKTKGTSVTQEKISDFEQYVLSPQTKVPPGDCIIIEFGEEKQHTTHLCETYDLALKRAQNGG